MCGIFGIVSTNPVNQQALESLVQHARQRGYREMEALLLAGGARPG